MQTFQPPALSGSRGAFVMPVFRVLVLPVPVHSIINNFLNVVYMVPEVGYMRFFSNSRHYYKF